MSLAEIPPDYLDVTETEGQPASHEQLERTCHRYIWAEKIVAGKHVVESACGSGLGLGILNKSAASLSAGDISNALLDNARALKLPGVDVAQYDAGRMPYLDNSKDVIILFEALYYLADQPGFFAECKRVLAPGGSILLANANCELFDFNPSPYSKHYPGITELAGLCFDAGFEPSFWGYFDTASTSWRQKILRPIKWLAVNFNLVPQSMVAKAILKRMFFGNLTALPALVSADDIDYAPPTQIPTGQPDRRHKVIYCQAVLPGNPSDPASCS